MEESTKKEIQTLAEEFQASQKVLTALGDENRQHLILSMMSLGNCSGVRVVDVSSKSSLSRPAVSHHLQILKEAGLLKSRKEGTKIYYYFDPDMKAINTLIDTLSLALRITKSLPDRGGEE